MPFLDDCVEPIEADTGGPQAHPDTPAASTETAEHGARTPAIASVAHLPFHGVNSAESAPVQQAVQRIAAGSAQRDAAGRFLSGNQVALKHGGYVEDVAGQRAIESALAAKRMAIESEVSGGSALSIVHEDVVSAYVELHAQLQGTADYLRTNGIITKGGRPRAALRVHLQLLDRWQRLAQMIGVERRERIVDSIHEELAAAERARQERGR